VEGAAEDGVTPGVVAAFIAGAVTDGTGCCPDDCAADGQRSPGVARAATLGVVHCLGNPLVPPRLARIGRLFIAAGGPPIDIRAGMVRRCMPSP